MSQPSPAQLEALLKFAAAKLNTSPEQLASTLSSGGTDALAASLSDADKAKLNTLLSDRKQLDALLQSDRVKGLLKRYTT